MTETVAAARGLLIGALTGALIAAVSASGAQAQALTADQIRGKANGIRYRAERALGNEVLACVNAPGSNTSAARVIRVYVTKRSALPKARKIVRALGATSVTTVGVVADQWSGTRRTRLAELLSERIAALNWSPAVNQVSNLDLRSEWPADLSRRGSSRVFILVSGAATPEQRSWAHAQVGHYPGRVGVFEIPRPYVPNPGEDVPVAH